MNTEELKEVRYLNSSDRALTVEFGNEISEKMNRRVRAFCLLLENSNIPGIVELVPTYRSVMIHYEPHIILQKQLIASIRQIVEDTPDIHLPESEIVDVPVYYGGESGPDLAHVAKAHGITAEEVIRLHSKPHYLIYMLGFTPGFAYLGGMSEKIATPRLSVPRTSLPPGSVGIAGSQTGIYPMTSPGGWQIIGQTPLVLYDPTRDEPILFEAGQRIIFRPITRDEYIETAGREPYPLTEQGEQQV